MVYGMWGAFYFEEWRRFHFNLKNVSSVEEAGSVTFGLQGLLPQGTSLAYLSDSAMVPSHDISAQSASNLTIAYLPDYMVVSSTRQAPADLFTLLYFFFFEIDSYVVQTGPCIQLAS